MEMLSGAINNKTLHYDKMSSIRLIYKFDR